VGSTLFTFAGVLEGIHNDWMTNTAARLLKGEYPLGCSFLNTIGGSLFFVGYIVDTSHEADKE
jgi:hypothetical protein